MFYNLYLNDSSRLAVAGIYLGERSEDGRRLFILLHRKRSHNVIPAQVGIYFLYI